MGCQLYWRPIGDGKPVGGSVLRDTVREEFGDEPMLDRGALPFLRGLLAARVDGARELIDAIAQHGDIQLFLRC